MRCRRKRCWARSENVQSANLPEPLVILGAVGNCIDILDAVTAMNSSAIGKQFQVLGFLDDDTAKHDRTIRETKVLGPLSMARDLPNATFVSGIGSPRNFRSKSSLIGRLGLPDERFASVVHPSAVVSPSATLGPGTVILANCTLCANVRFGNHVMMLPNCVLGHDTSVGEYSIFAAGVTVSGKVSIGRSCYLGAGSSIRDDVSIGDEALVGLGATVVADVSASSVVAGNPARRIGN